MQGLQGPTSRKCELRIDDLLIRLTVQLAVLEVDFENTVKRGSYSPSLIHLTLNFFSMHLRMLFTVIRPVIRGLVHN